jgi:hypothetical protein
MSASMTRPALHGLGIVATLASACSAPEGPPALDESLRPPRYLAASCSPVDDIARQDGVTTNAFLADLGTGRSCEVFLERDECVLAIFHDCTTSGRQWIGTASQDTDEVSISLSPMFERAPAMAPPRVCTGALVPSRVDPRAGTRLVCEGTAYPRGLYLERKDFSVKRFAELQLREQVSAGRFGVDEVLTDMRPVKVGDGTQLWYVADWTGGGMGGGVHRLIGSAESPKTQTVDSVSRATRLGATPSGLVLAAHGDDATMGLALSLYDASAVNPLDAKLATATTADSVIGIVGADGDRFLVGGKPRAGVQFQAKLYAADRAARTVRWTGRAYDAPRDTVLRAVAWTKPTASSAVAFVVAVSQVGSTGFGQLVGLDDNLNERWRTPANTPFDVIALEPLPGRGRVALLLGDGESEFSGPNLSNQYYEVDPSTGQLDPVVALPFGFAKGLSYDAARDRVYIAQFFGTVGYVERSPRVRAAQGYFKLDPGDDQADTLVSSMAWDPGRQRLVVADSRRSVLEFLKLL